jgi:hypothetical protein
MAGDPYKSVKAGDSLQISATAWNTLMQMAREAGERGALGSADIAGAQRDVDVVTLKNVTQTDCPRWGILGIDIPVFAPTTGQPVPRDFSTALAMRGVLATTPGYVGKWAVALEPIAAGKFGRAALSGVVPAIINVPSGVTPRYAEAEGTVYARAATSGSAQVLWVETGTGNRYAVLRMGAGSSGTVGKATVTAVGAAVGFYTCTIGSVTGLTVENLYETSAYYGALTFAPTDVTVTPQRLPVGSNLIAIQDSGAWLTCAPTPFSVTCA